MAAFALPALADEREITLELIMSDPDWIGNAPENPYWADDSASIYYEQKRQGEEHDDLVHMGLDGEVLAVVTDRDRGAADVADGDWSRDRKRKIYARAGDLYLKDVTSGQVRQLTRTVETEANPYFLVGETSIAFHRDSDVFVRELETGLEYQPAELLLTENPAEKEPAEGYIAEQEPRLLRWVREKLDKEEKARQREETARRDDPSRVPPPFYLGDKIEIDTSRLSPSGDWMILAVRPKDRDQGRGDTMPNYVSEGGYVTTREVRPKVGTGDSSGLDFLVLDLVRHKTFELDLSSLPTITEDPLAEIKKEAEAWRRQQAEDDDEDAPDDGDSDDGDSDDGDSDDGDSDNGEAKPRAVRFPFFSGDGLRFSPDGSRAALMLRSLDQKDRWIVLVERPEADAESVALTTAHHRRDESWIAWSFNGFDWGKDSRHLYFLSEESGYSQLYLYSTDDDATRRLTTGDYVVDNVQPGPDQRFLYYEANPDHPGIWEIYRVPVTGGPAEQLTRFGGMANAVVSPDGRKLLVTHSTTTRPPELYLLDLATPDEAQVGEATRLTRTVSETFSALPWVAPEIVPVPSTHQERPIFSRFYEASSDATRGRGSRRAAVVFVHGAGYLQNAHQGWSGYFREFMFHTLLTRRGYHVLDMDFRASRGYGRDWRAAIYRRMGTPELEDLEDGVAWLVGNHGVDPARVGVYGGSYGGFLAFMALFKEPELFAAGAALRPVTDWAHYNHPYTSNILNTPEVDPEAYRRSSPIEFAEGLQKPLLICSGMQDDNVLFQDTVRLVQRLIELGKEDFETAIYPIEAHGFREPSSWLDEYRRVFKLFEEHLWPGDS